MLPRSLALAVAFGLAAWLLAWPTPADTPGDARPLEAGFAEADITPKLGDKPVWMAGFGHNRIAKGVHDPLMARVVVLRHAGRKLALVSLDVVGWFYPRVEKVRRRLPGFDYVLVSSTHNHEGPDTMGLWGPTPFQSGVDAEYLKTIDERIVEAVKAADAASRPVRARLGTARAPQLLHDAREPIVKHDELVALEFRPADAPLTLPSPPPGGEGRVRGDKVQGLVVQWNCHPETLDSKNTQLSADFVGCTVKALKQKYDCPVVYLTGTVGGLMTSLHVEVRNARGEALADGTFEKTERYGQLLADEVSKALQAARPVALTPIRVRQRLVYLPVENKLYQLARQLGVVPREVFAWKGNPDSADPVANPAPPNQAVCLRTELAWLRLGDLDIAAIPGEIYPELILDKVQDPPDPGADFPNAPIEPAIYKQLRGPHRMVIGLANDEIGYIIPKRQWDEKPPFCYGRTKAQYGEVNSLGPDTAPLLCKAFQALTAGKK